MKRKILAVDLNLCTGCRSCELRCSFKHTNECKPNESRIQVLKLDRVGMAVPLFCLGCEEAFCQEICPTVAIQRDDKTGAIVLDEKRCIGCRACTMVCPFSGIRALSNGKIIKCDLCAGDPYCVKYCETGALKYIELDDIADSRDYLLAEKFVHPYLKEK